VVTFLESRVSTLMQPALFTSGASLQLLRLSNRLLRRLSRVSRPRFCGRVLLLMAYVFSLDERSGVNLAGAFNTNNVTLYETGDADAPAATASSSTETAMDVDEPAAKRAKTESSGGGSGSGDGGGDGGGDAPVDLSFYRTLWQLQDTFRNPSSLATTHTQTHTDGADDDDNENMNSVSAFLSRVDTVHTAFEVCSL
jgi:hypothetical protein